MSDVFRRNWRILWSIAEVILLTVLEAQNLHLLKAVDKYAMACMPILSSGDVTGAVAFMESEKSTVVSELQKSLISAASQFLGKQIE